MVAVVQPHPIRPGYTQTWRGVICWVCGDPIYEAHPDPPPSMVKRTAADGSTLGWTNSITRCERCPVWLQ